MKNKPLFVICLILNMNVLLNLLPSTISNDLLDKIFISYVIDDIDNDKNIELIGLIKDDYNMGVECAVYKFKNNNWEYMDSQSAGIYRFWPVYPEKIDAPFPISNEKYKYVKYDLYFSYKFEGNKLVKQEKLSDYIYNYILNKKISAFNNNRKEIYNFAAVFYYIYENRSMEDARKWYFDNIKKVEYKECEKYSTDNFFNAFREKYIN